jgi:ribosomal protein L19
MNKKIFELVYSGCVVKVKFVFFEKVLEFFGVCVSKHMKTRKLILRNFIVNTSVDYVFFLDCPNIITFIVLFYPKFKVTKAKGFFLKGKFNKEFLKLYSS